jgi:hypothetical protein
MIINCRTLEIYRGQVLYFWLPIMELWRLVKQWHFGALDFLKVFWILIGLYQIERGYLLE